MMFRCHCCDEVFRSDKPQDPQRDRGYGTCEGCRPRQIADMVRYGFAGLDFTVETATARVEKYA